MASESPFTLLRPELAGASAFYVTGEDHLRVRSFNAAAGVQLAVEGRFMNCDGRIVPFADRHVANVDRTEATSFVTLGEGYLLNLHARVSAGSPKRGQCYVCVELVRGRTGAAQPLACLLQGYVASGGRLAWPGSAMHQPTEGPGAIRSITGADPAAGAEFSETVPTAARWRLMGVAFTLVTDATVANRIPNLIVDDGAAEILRVSAAAAQTASTTIEYSAIAGGYSGGSGATRINLPLPADLILSAGYRVRSETNAIVAGDNYSAPQLLVEEWIEPA